MPAPRVPDGIGDWIRRRASTAPDRPAIIFRDRQISYRELADRIDRLAAALADRGFGAGDRIAFIGNNHPALVEVLFASARFGAIMVPLNTRLSARELAYMLHDSGASVLISTSGLEATVAAAAVPDLDRIVVSDGAAGAFACGVLPAGVQDYEAVLASASKDVAEAAANIDDPALIIYTSGTTGRPKGAMLSHGDLTWNAINVITDYDVVSTDRALMISPLFHVASLGMGCLPVLLKGGTVLLEERFVPGDALRTIERLRATSISGVPTTYQLMAEDPAWESTDISSLRLLTCGGSAVPDRVREAYEARGLAFSGGYGMTETSPGVTMLPPQHSQSRAGSAGLAHFFTRFRVRGADGALAAPGEPGQIEVRGPNVFLGYWGNPEGSGQVWTDDGWLQTGDIGFTDDDGFLYISDRLKDMIISGGENIYPAEVEQSLLGIDGVTGAAVIGVPHERWGEVPHAIVTLAEGATLDPGEMVAILSTRLARYNIPRTLEVVDALPRPASGKVRKQTLRERYAAQS
jgi:fatty-acyl-CoA synthase